MVMATKATPIIENHIAPFFSIKLTNVFKNNFLKKENFTEPPCVNLQSGSNRLKVFCLSIGSDVFCCYVCIQRCVSLVVSRARASVESSMSSVKGFSGPASEKIKLFFIGHRRRSAFCIAWTLAGAAAARGCGYDLCAAINSTTAAMETIGN